MPTRMDAKNAPPDHARVWIIGRHKKKLGRVALLIALCCMLLMAWFVYQQTTEPVAGDITEDAHEVSQRIVVPALKALPEDKPDVLTTKRDEEGLLANTGLDEEDLAFKDARMKSAIMAQDVSLEAEDKFAADAIDGLRESGTKDPNAQFLSSVSGRGVPSSTAQAIGALEYKVLQGKLIEAVLESRASSDLPGMVCATVQRDVYGAQKRIKLIPWGARVCGQYSADVRTGQERLFVVWNTLRRPDGVEVALDSAGADQLGTAGMGGLVDTHFAKLFGVSSLLSIIGAGAGAGNQRYGDAGNAAGYYRDSVHMAATQTAQQILQPYINMSPTIIVPAGARIRIYVNRDLDFSAMYQAKVSSITQPDVMIYE